MTGLTAEQIRSFLKDNVTVVAPGETLVIRAPDLTPNQARELSDLLNWVGEDGPYLPFRTIVVPGDELGVVKADTDDAFAAVLLARINEERRSRGMKPWVFR